MCTHKKINISAKTILSYQYIRPHIKKKCHHWKHHHHHHHHHAIQRTHSQLPFGTPTMIVACRDSRAVRFRTSLRMCAYKVSWPVSRWTWRRLISYALLNSRILPRSYSFLCSVHACRASFHTTQRRKTFCFVLLSRHGDMLEVKPHRQSTRPIHARFCRTISTKRSSPLRFRFDRDHANWYASSPTLD